MRFATARTVDAETTRRPPRGQEDGVNETSIVTEFRWIEAGGGLPVLCLHGLFGTSDHWERLVEAISPRCRAMALTLPIFETPPDDLSVSGLRAYVEAFLGAERVPPAVVIGNSLGGHVALDLALNAPERVRGLVLSGSSGLFERSFTRDVPHRPSTAFVREKMTDVFHDPAMVTPEWVEEIRDRVSRRSYALRVLQVSRSAKRYNLEDRLGEIRCPTLLVWGTEDKVTPRDVAIRFLDGIPSATIRLVPECGHAPMLEHPEAFANAVDEFLDTFEPESVTAL
jgi:pimeloyl-ACP methyl ester carboxylesterase